MQILSDTRIHWDITLMADVATRVVEFYFRERIQTVTKPRFRPRLGHFLMNIITVVYAHASGRLLRLITFQGMLGCVYLMIWFNLRVFFIWFVWYNIIPGNFGFARY